MSNFANRLESADRVLAQFSEPLDNQVGRFSPAQPTSDWAGGQFTFAVGRFRIFIEIFELFDQLMLVGLQHGTFIHVPLAVVTRETRALDTESDLWRAVMECTGQPARMG